MANEREPPSNMEPDEDIADQLPAASATLTEDWEELLDSSAPDLSHDNRPENVKRELDLYGDAHRMDEPATDLYPTNSATENEQEQYNLNDDTQGVVFGETLNEMMLRLSNEFAPVNEADADTLLYIGPPPRSARQDDYDYNIIEAHFSKPYLMRSSSLKALNSAKFDKFLGPMSARTERRLKKLGIHMRVPDRDKIKYYIDLRPDIEGDEGLILLTELTSGPGVLSWHRTAERFKIDPRFVAGTDELNAPPRPRYTKDDEVSTYEEITLDTDEPQEAPSSPSKRRKKSNAGAYRPQQLRSEDKLAELYNRPIGDDYYPLRHHSAIERLLHAIAGNDPKLDSAPKAWTYCAVANYFDCSAIPRINDWLTTWLLTSANANFIQANPEVVYRMAAAMKAQDLLRCTFAMLVGEKALQKSKTGEIKTVGEPKKTVHGRMICNIDDDDINRVDHAIPSLTNRAKATFMRLIDPAMYWTLLSAERGRLEEVGIETQEESDLVSKAKTLLADFVRRQILTAAFDELMYDTRKPNQTNTDKISSFVDVYSNLKPAQRLLTQSFWIMLSRRGFYTEHDRPNELIYWKSVLPRLQESGMVTPGDDIPFVSRVQLFAAFADLNHMIAEKYHAENPFNPQREESPCGKSPRGALRLVQAKWPHPEPLTGVDQYGRPIKGPDSYSRPLPVRPRKIQFPPPNYQAERAGVSTSVDLPQPLAQVHGTNTKFVNTSEDSDSDWDDVTPDRTQFPLELEEDIQILPPKEAPNSDAIQQQQAGSSHDHLEARYNIKNPEHDPFRFQAYQHPKQTHDKPLPIRPRFEPVFPTNAEVDKAFNLKGSSSKGKEPEVQEDDEQTRSKRADFFHDDRTRQLSMISVPHILTELTGEMRRIITDSMITPGYIADRTCEWDIPVDENDTLLCLTDDEWKYLPLWAGGLDDGTGGVFDDGVEVPDAPDVDDGGFRGGVMGLHSAMNSDAGSVLGSDFEEIRTEMGVSTVGRASRQATDGTVGGSTVMSLDE